MGDVTENQGKEGKFDLGSPFELPPMLIWTCHFGSEVRQKTREGNAWLRSGAHLMTARKQEMEWQGTGCAH